MKVNIYKIFFVTLFIFLYITVINQNTGISDSRKQLQTKDKKTRLFFWYTVNPGFPPQQEWKTQDTGISLYKEMQYGNMKSRHGSKEYFKRLKMLGFDAIVLNGFHGPYKPEIKQPIFPNDLEHFLQSRNYNYYIPWAKKAGLDAFLQVMFFSQGSASSFSWTDDTEWKNIEVFLSFVAKVAKSSGCRGISFDFEPYYDFIKKNPWTMIKLEKNSKKREDVLLLVKKRAAQMAKAIYKEFPQAEIHMYDIGAGANSFLSKRSPVSAQEFIGDDFGDIVAYFLAGFLSHPFTGGVHIDEASSYYIYEPNKLKSQYRTAILLYKENVLVRWDFKDYMEKNFSIGLALVVHHRWDVRKYWNKVKHVNNKSFRETLETLLSISPYIWVYPGETDWIYPEIADQLPIPKSIDITESPYKSHSERMTAFTTILRNIKKH